MRHILFSFFLLPFLLFFSSNTERQPNNKYRPKPGGTARWTGTISYYEKTEGITGKSERHVSVSFVNALPTLYRDDGISDLNFTDDKGTGTVTFHAEAIIDGKKFGVTDCRGSGQSELHWVVVDETDSTYEFHAIGPACTGTSVSFIDGSTTPHGPEQTDIVISQERLVNKNVLTGSRTTVSDMGGAGTATMTTTWRLERSRDDVELIVTPENYDNWLPEPGRDEIIPGSVMNISLKLQGRNGRPLTVKAKSFELHLLNTSREKGITLNSPKRLSNDRLPDMSFLIQPNTPASEELQSITIPCSNGTTGQAKIGSFDGGGWTTLIATAILTDDTRIKGTLLVPSGVNEIPIPKRDPGSMIATKWLNDNDNPGEYEDNETSTGNSNNGDGFTTYEEYRGFMSEGKFVRLNPKKKELAVQVKVRELSLLSEGMSWFENASDIKIVRFYLHEVANNRQINFNSGHAHDYDQYVLKLEKGALPENKAGKAFTTSDKPDIPKNTKQVIVSTDNIRQNYLNWSGWARSQNLQLPWTEKEYLAQTIAHELGHGVKVSHHGDYAIEQGITAGADNRPVYHIFNRDAVEITVRPYSVPGDDYVCPGVAGSQASGDLHCVMAYIDVCSWAYIPYADGSVGLFQSPLLAIGRKFCITKDGTGINAGTHMVSGVAYDNYYGKAVNGKCLSQITLK